MTTKILKYATIAMATIIASTGAYAHQHGDGHGGDREKRAEMREKMKEHRKMRHHDMMKEIDANGDEKVDLNEFLANAERRFQELDANDDGYVTQGEAREHHKMLRKKHMKMRKEMREEMHEMMEDAEEE